MIEHSVQARHSRVRGYSLIVQGGGVPSLQSVGPPESERPAGESSCSILPSLVATQPDSISAAISASAEIFIADTPPGS
jgi:hypothetical protein